MKFVLLTKIVPADSNEGKEALQTYEDLCDLHHLFNNMTPTQLEKISKQETLIAAKIKPFKPDHIS